MYCAVCCPVSPSKKSASDWLFQVPSIHACHFVIVKCISTFFLSNYACSVINGDITITSLFRSRRLK